MTKYMALGLIIAGMIIGIVSTLLVQRCDVEAAMRPLVYALNELSGRNCR